MKRTGQILALITILILLPAVNILKAQGDETKPSLDSGTLDSQFDYVMNKSSNYLEYKVVKKAWLLTLKSHFTDSLNAEKAKFSNSQKTIASKNGEIDSLQSDLRSTTEKLTYAIREKNTLKLFGLNINKVGYNGIMWTLTGILAVSLLIFFALFKRSNTITVQTKKDLREVKEEYEAHRKRAREREERLVHDLHAEKNKNKNLQI